VSSENTLSRIQRFLQKPTFNIYL